MKKIALMMLAAAALFTSCKPEVFTLSQDQVVIYEGEAIQVEATLGGTAVVAEWASADETVATVENGLITGVSVGETEVTATYEGQTLVVKVSVEEFVEEQPTIEAPGAGKVTIALQAPKGTCNGIVLVGAGVKEDGSDDWTPANKAHQFVAVEGTVTWYTITLNYKENLAVKAIAITEAGVADWGTQWGMNIEGEAENVIVLSENATIDNSENGGEVKVTEFTDGEVVYVQVKAWKSEPCTPKNEAGTATFTLTSASVPANAVVGVIGNLNNWDLASVVEMTAGEGGVYTATVEVPAACEYKYILNIAGAGYSWDTAEDGGNRQMALDLKANDTVEKWLGVAAE